jgi:hypothetical protein
MDMSTTYEDPAGYNTADIEKPWREGDGWADGPEYDCPVCGSTDLQYCMYYPLYGEDDGTTELYECGQCGAHGEADDCRATPRPPQRKPVAIEDDLERARRYGKGDYREVA